ncbi:MAG: hypothetical protein A2V92_05425 [Candidatus Muproteobacteria bacterium RBG_16_65_31]|uniref:Lipoprotein LPP20-like domain-containing protein n=1 Tax=Candidatus Muproteobacteria bacterium RBG_16_65_31 TaxID=1817759 RepID=A0A1F6TGJ4_9PROT|nr:MAG: hypothetical protein A2V92_05425 [Candidatus Muproteobacteria bacterium RBG_16_65_31]
MRNTLVIVAAAAALLAGCASGPDWLTGESDRYRSAQYLLGRGEAASLEEAKDRARADLAKIFEVTVVVDTEDIQTYKTAGRERPAGEYAAQARRRITTRAERIVQGIQIAELWQDPDSGAHYALAVLPRAQAAASLRQEIERLDAVTRDELERARMTGDLLLRIGIASRAYEAQLERQSYQKSLKIVDVTGRGIAPPWELDRLRADLGELLGRVRVAPRVVRDDAGGLDTVAGGALAAAGFLIETGQNPGYLLETALELDDLGLRDGWFWTRGVLEVRLVEVAGSRVRGTQRWAIKVAATDRTAARRRALDEADKILKRDLRATLIGFAAAK